MNREQCDKEEFVKRATEGHFSKEDVLWSSDGDCYFIISFETNRCFGDIYRVRDENDQKKLMVWYKNKERFEDTYQKVCGDVNKGAPGDMFIWPESILKNIDSSFGYILPIASNCSYVDLYKLREESIPINVLLTACKNVAVTFRCLHKRGLCLENFDVSDFLFDKDTGSIMVCNYENVGLISSVTDYLIAWQYAAPEIIEGDRRVSEYTDRFILAVVIFKMLMMGHPFEGRKMWGLPCLTEGLQKELVGRNATFIFDPTDDSNRPDNRFQKAVLYNWDKIPDLIKELFYTSFSEVSIKDPKQRPSEDVWITALESYITA